MIESLEVALATTRLRDRLTLTERALSNVDALCRDAISTCEYLIPMAPASEQLRLWKQITDLRAALNAEMRGKLSSP